MSRFINDTTGIVVSVTDEKDSRFDNGWKPAAESESKPRAKKPAESK